MKVSRIYSSAHVQSHDRVIFGGDCGRYQRGQALTEFLVAALALIPLLLLVPIIAKYQDIAHATQMASRYIAFEATTRNGGISTWKPESQLANEVRRRFFSHQDAPIKTGDTAGNFMAHQNLFWRAPSGDALIPDLDRDVTVSFGEGGSPSHNGAFRQATEGQIFGLHRQLGLEARGIYRANVATDVANLPSGIRAYEPFDAIGVRMARSTSILIDPWTSGGPQQTDERVSRDEGIFPAGPLQAITPIVDSAVMVIDGLGGSRAPRLGHLDFWQDVVPGDRLK